MENRISPFLISVLCIGIAILYIPILVLIGYSFNSSALVSVWGGFSTRWYTELIHNDQILDAAWLSLKIGVAVSTGAVILGTLAAISLVRFKVFRGRFLLTGMVNAPLVMPEIITGITQLLLFVSMLNLLGWPHRGFTTIVIAHIAFCSAYVTVTVQSDGDALPAVAIFPISCILRSWMIWAWWPRSEAWQKTSRAVIRARRGYRAERPGAV